MAMQSLESVFVPIQEQPLLLLPCLAVLGLLLWRMGKFTILPLFYRRDPKELPYWIPVLGHAVSFFRNSNRMLDYAKGYFEPLRQPYAITVAGSKLYIITDPKDVTAAYKNTSTFSFDIFVQAMMKTSGSSDHVVTKMFQPPDPEKEIFSNPNRKPLAKLARELHIHQLFPGKELDSLCDTFLEYFKRELNLKTMSHHPYVSSVTSHEVVLNLYTWTSDVLICGGQEAYFGPLLAETEPNLSWDFLIFDDLTWQVLYQYPRFLAGTMIKAKGKVIAGLERYFNVPAEQRGGMAWFTPAMEAEMRNLGFNTHDVAVMMMTIYWGINTNTRRGCFWMLANMLFEPGLFQIVRDETKACFVDGKPDMKRLEANCPRLNGIWDETIRLSAYSSSVRYITDDTLIGGKLLRKGNRVMIPNRQLHFNERVFGDRVQDFVSTRFVNNPDLTRNMSWRPFGGGTTMCPGRFIAKEAVTAFVAMIVQRFDIELAGQQEFPRLEDGNPVLGIMSSKGGDDLLIRLTPRSEVS